MRKATTLLALFVLSVCAGCSSLQQKQWFSPLATETVRGNGPLMWSKGTGRRVSSLIDKGWERREASVAPTTNIKKYLFVSDFSVNSIYEFEAGTYQLVSSISYANPNGLWIDGLGNLYAANWPATPSEYPPPGVIEYSPSASSPSCIYSGGIDPVNVTVDRSGDVYAADYNYGGNGYIDRYSQCSPSIKTKYMVGGAPQGLAIDAKSNLYVSYNSHVTGAGALEEFPADSKTPVHLRATFHFAGGLIFDGSGNLLACDQGSPNSKSTLDLIKPPYNQINRRYRGFNDCYHLSLTKGGKVLYVADLSSVYVLDYPSGTLLATLGASYGISNPAGVAALPSLVP